jgi:teichuronic acid biosynthesis glycosyltransferase TuaC
VRFLTFTSLFPNSLEPQHGIFVYQRVKHIAELPGNSLRVVAPVPYYPSWMKAIGASRWRKSGRVPEKDELGNLPIWYPRYLVLPKIGMSTHGISMFLNSLPLVKRIHAEMPVDCIDAHYIYPDCFAAVLLGKRLNVPVFVTARGTDINLFPEFASIRPMIRWTLRQARGVIAVSNALKERMQELGTPADKIRVVANGVDIERFHPIDRAEARRHLGVPTDGPLVVSVGSLVPHKGHQRVINALAEISPRRAGLRLYVVGEGSYRKQLETLIREKGLSGRAVLMGQAPNEELKYWYSAADVTCLASDREGMPNVLLESLACGTAVLATRVGGVPEVVVSPQLGVLVEPNEQGVTAGLELALGTQWDRSAIVSAAQRRSWGAVAQEVDEFVRSRISGAGSSRQQDQPVSHELT